VAEYIVKLTTEQIKLLLSITGPRIATDPTNEYNDWSVDMDRRLREAELDA
jgi:hypothetical protein